MPDLKADAAAARDIANWNPYVDDDEIALILRLADMADRLADTERLADCMAWQDITPIEAAQEVQDYVRGE